MAGKTFRVYYHAKANFPQVWSIDEGQQVTEIHVKGFCILGCTVTSEATDQNKPGEPAGWLEIRGAGFELVNGCAVFRPQA